jgi:hypothetical protein
VQELGAEGEGAAGGPPPSFLLALASEASGQRERFIVAAPDPRVALAPLGGAACEICIACIGALNPAGRLCV